MIPIKTSEEIRKMRESGHVAAAVLKQMAAKAAPGVNTYDLDQFGRELMEEYGARSACHGHRLRGEQQAYPSHTCLSVNEEVVHGIASLRRVLRPGDILAIDVALFYGGYIGDNAMTVGIGPLDPEVERLMSVTREALHRAAAQARSGKRVGDISRAVQKCADEAGFSVVREFVGHGVGRGMHEEPQIPNFAGPRKGGKLKPGMTLAIEPMINMGGSDVEIADDGWTARTRDGKPSAHFEHTVLVTAGKPEILTPWEK